MKLGPNTKAALSQVLETAHYSKSDATAIPTGARPNVEAVRAIYAGKQPNGPRDPHFEALDEWAEQRLSEALEKDNAPEKPKAEPVKAAPVEPEPPKADAKAEPDEKAEPKAHPAKHETVHTHGKGHK